MQVWKGTDRHEVQRRKMEMFKSCLGIDEQETKELRRIEIRRAGAREMITRDPRNL